MKRALFLAASFAASLAPVHAAEPKKLGDDVLLQADEVVYDSDKHIVTAHGHVEVDRDGRMLMCDVLVYDQNADVLTASGHVSMLDAKGNVAFADHATLKDKMRDGALQGFAALIGKTGRLAAPSATREQDRYTTAIRAATRPARSATSRDSARPCGRSRPIASSTTS